MYFLLPLYHCQCPAEPDVHSSLAFHYISWENNLNVPITMGYTPSYAKPKPTGTTACLFRSAFLKKCEYLCEHPVSHSYSSLTVKTPLKKKKKWKQYSLETLRLFTYENIVTTAGLFHF